MSELQQPSYTYELETLLKNLPGMAYRCLNLPHWPMDFVSDGCLALTGYANHEIVSQQVLWGDFTHPEDIGFVDQEVRLSADSGKSFECEYRIHTKDGTEKWVWERGRPIDYQEDGTAVIEGFITDITEKKQVEIALRRSRSYSQAVVDSAVEAVIGVTQQGFIESYNQAAEAIFSKSFLDQSDITWHSLFAIKEQKTIQPYFSKHLQTKATPQGLTSPKHVSQGHELDAIDEHGNRFPVHLTISQVQTNPQPKYIFVIRDLTAQRLAEKEVREHRELLAHVDRINSMGEMASAMAHEINQPLTAISLYATTALALLDKDESGADRVADVLQKLTRQSHRAGAVLERMQKMTKHRESYQETVDCRLMMEEVHKLAEVEARLRNFTISLAVDKDLPKAHCDAIQIQQVILNLLRNGMEAVEQPDSNGEIIFLRAEKDLKVANDGGGVKISIIDSGSGISKSDAEQLYQPFRSGKEEGMGLGLSISKSIINAHGGELEFMNNSHKGTTFYFTLPAATDEA